MENSDSEEDFCTNVGDHDTGDSDGWEDTESATEQTICLFCPRQFLTLAVALDHCRADHNFDLLELKSRFNMDCYSYIKMINYIRKVKPNPEEVNLSRVAPWNDDLYLKPGEMESWLMYDFDDLGSAPSTPHYAIDGKRSMSNISYSDLQHRIEELENELKFKNMLLESAKKDIAQMKEVTKSLVEGPSKDSNTRLSISRMGDSDYFCSYSHFGIHHEMLDDKVRTESYRDAILNNRELFEGKLVLDVGCGTGILSMFCAKAGALKVFGIDQSEVLYKAMEIVRENKLEEKIHLVRSCVENVELPVQKVDIIVSEWMGYFLLFEGMLDSFIHARDKYLNPQGIVLPNRCNISIVGVSDTEQYNKFINFWNDVQGFSMQCMKREVLQEAFIETVPPNNLITTSSLLLDIDLMTCDKQTCEFTSKFTLSVLNDGYLTALAGYFDTYFNLPNKVNFSTGPHSTKTHWQQTVFYLKEPILVSRGTEINGVLTCSRLPKNNRGLSITIALEGHRYKYILD